MLLPCQSFMAAESDDEAIKELNAMSVSTDTACCYVIHVLHPEVDRVLA